MTFENRYELIAKIGFLAVLTLLIVGAGNAENISHYQSQLQSQFLSHN